MKNQEYDKLQKDFIEWMKRLNYSEKSVQERSRQLRIFFGWIEEKGILKLSDLRQNNLEAYNKWLHEKPIKSRTIRGYIGALKLCNQYLENQGSSPIMTIQLQVGKDVEYIRNILSKEEVKSLYKSCVEDLYGMRDRAMIAVFYGCGLRCREGANLELRDIDFKSGLLHVRKGKGYKQRYVPMSRGVMKELKSWLENGQPFFSIKTNLVIPSRSGKIIGCHGLTKRVKKMCERASVSGPVSLHGLRHSIATHLLESGMSLEQIGQFLGHSSLETTQIYTRINEGI